MKNNQPQATGSNKVSRSAPVKKAATPGWLVLWMTIVLAGASLFLSAVCIELFTPEYMKNSSGFGHPAMCGFAGLASAFAVVCANGFMYVFNSNRTGGSSTTDTGYAMATGIAFLVVTGLSYWYYWQSHHCSGHVCHPWSP